MGANQLKRGWIHVDYMKTYIRGEAVWTAVPLLKRESVL